MTRKRKGTAGDDPQQLQIDWTAGDVPRLADAVRASAASFNAAPAIEPLVQRLFWDFKTSFPQPTDEAIDNGLLDESDRQPENLKSLHENYATQCLATLAALDKVLDARRADIDPGTGHKPRTHASRERLRQYLAEEPGRLEHTFEILIGTYADAFGQEAADAFKKAIIARYAGIEVMCEKPAAGSKPTGAGHKERPPRVSSRLPVPRPSQSSVAAGVFGRDENGTPIRPDADEIRAITEEQAEKMMEMDDAEIRSAIAKYAEDFGSKAAAQLERCVRKQQRSR